VYGCVNPSGRAYRLGSTREFCIGTQSVDPVVVAGQLAAYGLSTCGVDAGYTVVVVRRLLDGEQLHSDHSITGPVGPESYQSVGSLALKGDGAVAWIAEGRSIIGHGPQPIEVHRHDSRGERLLDSGAAIDPKSLRLTGSTLTWTRAGQTESATLR